MRVILFVFAVLAFFAGFGILSGATSAIHEIEGFVLFTIAAVFFSGACIVDAILQVAKQLNGQMEESDEQ